MGSGIALRLLSIKDFLVGRVKRCGLLVALSLAAVGAVTRRLF